MVYVDLLDGFFCDIFHPHGWSHRELVETIWQLCYKQYIGWLYDYMIIIVNDYMIKWFIIHQ